MRSPTKAAGACARYPMSAARSEAACLRAAAEGAGLRNDGQPPGTRSPVDSRSTPPAPCRSIPRKSFPLSPGKTVPLFAFHKWDKARSSPEERQLHRISRHDDFVVEPPGGNHQQQRSHREQRQRVQPQMRPARPAKNNAARDVDEIRCRHKVTEHVKEF